MAVETTPLSFLGLPPDLLSLHPRRLSGSEASCVHMLRREEPPMMSGQSPRRPRAAAHHRCLPIPGMAQVWHLLKLVKCIPINEIMTSMTAWVALHYSGISFGFSSCMGVVLKDIF